MYIPCWKCGEDVWYETQFECRKCKSTVRRCLDCTNYKPGAAKCAALDIDITPEDAEHPTRLSPSFSCHRHAIAAETVAALRKARPVQKAAPPERGPERPAAPAAPAAGEPPHLPEQPAPTPEAKAAPRPKHPIVIAHRGASACAPENTLAAFRIATERGAQAVELDVHVTADGQAVVIHDGSVDRTTDRYGAVSELPFEEVRRMDAGSWFAAEFAGERIPTLAEVYTVVPAPTWVNIHLRSHENTSDRSERAVAEAIHRADALARTWVTHHTRHGLYRLRKMLPELRVCWTSRGGPCDEEYVDDAYYMGYRLLQVPYHAASADLVTYAHERGLWVNVSHVSDPGQMRALVAQKVDGIFCDDPAELREIIAEAKAGA
jgi:glycerophosphoryl diester phosphodiesterase